MKILLLMMVLLSSRAAAQDVDVSVILFGTGNLDVGFTYDETANLALGVSLATPMCAGGGVAQTTLQELNPGTPQGLGIAGVTTWTSGCEVAWDGYADLTGATPGGYPAIGGVAGSEVADPPQAVPEPTMLWLLAGGVGGLVLRRLPLRRLKGFLRQLFGFLGILVLAIVLTQALGRLAGAPACRPAPAFFLQDTPAECR
jgi:hypothetical protein